MVGGSAGLVLCCLPGAGTVGAGGSALPLVKGLNQPSLSKVEMEEKPVCRGEEGGCELLFPQGLARGGCVVLSPPAQREVGRSLFLPYLLVAYFGHITIHTCPHKAQWGASFCPPHSSSPQAY